MVVSFLESNIELRTWESKEDLTRYLGEYKGGSLLIKEPSEHERKFYSATLRPDYLGKKGEAFGIGVCSEGHGPLPQLLPLPEKRLLLFGVDNDLVSFDTDMRHVAFRLRLDISCIFRSFVQLKRHAVILVFHELGVTALSEDCQKLWDYSKDVLVDAELDGRQLKLQFMDAEPVALDIRNGRAIR